MKRVSVAMTDELIQMVDLLRKQRVGSADRLSRAWSRDFMCSWLISRSARALLEQMNQTQEEPRK